MSTSVTRIFMIVQVDLLSSLYLTVIQKIHNVQIWSGVIRVHVSRDLWTNMVTCPFAWIMTNAVNQFVEQIRLV